MPDKIAGLDSGSNDYLTKPFDFAELEARIRALLRQVVHTKGAELSHCGLRMDTATKQVFWRDASFDLTKKEYAILEYLMAHSDRVASAEELIEHVWDSETNPFSNSFRFHISSLRKKLAAASGSNGLILTLRGQGYRLVGQEEQR